jgi:hypothetical protein
MTDDRYIGGAVISDCGTYRYRLIRMWGFTLPTILWVMLNPSTADDKTNDPTIRRCIEFSKAWGFGNMLVCNLFAYRSTDPSVLKRITRAEAEGPENTGHIVNACGQVSKIVCAWGAPGGAAMPDMLVPFADRLECLGVTKSGAPRHPLYLAADTPLQRWPC